MRALEGHEWSPRQKQVLGMLAQGKTNPQIANDLGISLDGAKWHVSEVLSKLGLHSREDAAAYWLAYNRPRRRLKRALHGIVSAIAFRWAAVGMALAAVVGVAAVLRSAGGDESPAVVSPTDPAGTVTPVASATTGPPPEIVGPIFAYSRDASPPSRPGEVREVVFHDLGTGQDAWSFQYGSFEDSPVRELVAGNRVVLATASRVRVTGLFGGDARVLVELEGDARVSGSSLSRDNQLLAVSSWDATPPYWRIDVIEVATGEIVQSVTAAHPALADFTGAPGRITWQPGDHAFAIAGVSESEMYGDVAMIALDGSVRMWQTGGYPMLSPNGTRVAWANVFANDCYEENPSLGEDLTLIDLVSGTEHVLDLGRVTPLQWSPDSAWLLYDLHSPVAGSCDWATDPTATIRADFLSTASVPVPSRSGMLLEWNRQPLIEMDCGDGKWRLVALSWDGRRLGNCGESGRIRVNSDVIGEGRQVEFFGLVSGPALPGDQRTVVYVREPDFIGVREVIAYGIATGEGRIITGVDGPVDAGAGMVVMASGRRVTVFDLGGAPPYDLVVGDGSRTINDVALSPDGTLLAVALGDTTGDWNVDILRSTDGVLVSRLDSATDAPIGPPDAYPSRLHWREDGRGVVVAGGVSRGSSAGLLTFWVDGSDTRIESPGFHAVSPDGRLAVVGFDSDETPNCLFINSHTLQVVDLETLAVVAEHNDPVAVFNAPAWDSASSMVALNRYEPPFDEACEWSRQQPSAIVVDVVTGTVAGAADRAQVAATWSDAVIRCDGDEQPISDSRFFSRRGECLRGASTHELLVDGVVVDTTARSYELLGMIE